MFIRRGEQNSLILSVFDRAARLEPSFAAGVTKRFALVFGRSLGGSPRPILAPMDDLLARLHTALGDDCSIESGEWYNIVLDGRRNAH
jgi:hypothetical protein